MRRHPFAQDALDESSEKNEMRIFAVFCVHGMPYAFGVKLLLVVLCSVFLWAAGLQAEEIGAPKVAILVSRNIRPYIEAVEGVSSVLSEAANVKIQVFRLEKFKGKLRAVLIRKLVEEKFDLFVAVGPEAAGFAWEEPGSEKTARLYSMVLNPPKVSVLAETACGISLNIPAHRQLKIIAQGLPAGKRLGLLYDPRYNSEFFRKAAAEASFLGLKIVSLKVLSKKDIPIILKQHWEDMDALWLIPDQTVISESIVQYIIREALFEKVPVIGYNRFFYESGAALAFVFDYEEIGRQTGRLAVNILSGRACETGTPVFHVWLNLRVIDKLGINVPEEKSPSIEVGP